MEFNQYIFNQGEVIHQTKVSKDVINEYKDILPTQVIELWKTYGFSGISNGLVWLLNPKEYEFIREDWEQTDNVISLKDQKPYLVARSAFGDLMFYIVENNGDSYFSMVDVLYNTYRVLGDTDIDFFFDFWLNDKTFAEMYYSEKLFKECLEKLGPLQPDECYGFVPLPVLGGDKSIEYAQKVKMMEYLKICAQSQM